MMREMVQIGGPWPVVLYKNGHHGGRHMDQGISNAVEISLLTLCGIDDTISV
jgi:hypothetical protein